LNVKVGEGYQAHFILIVHTLEQGSDNQPGTEKLAPFAHAAAEIEQDDQAERGAPGLEAVLCPIASLAELGDSVGFAIFVDHEISFLQVSDGSSLPVVDRGQQQHRCALTLV